MGWRKRRKAPSSPLVAQKVKKNESEIKGESEMKNESEGDPTMEWKLEETNGKEENNGSSRLASCCSEGEIQCESEMKSESEVDPTWNGN